MNIKRNIIILTIICIILGGINIVIMSIPEKEATILADTKTTEVVKETFKISDFNVSQVIGVSLKNKDLSLGIIQRGMEFEFITNSGNNFGISEIRSLIYAMCNMEGLERFEDQSLYENYGLDNPQAQVTIILADGTEYSYVLLSKVGEEENYYLFDMQETCIYLVEKYIGEMMLSSSKDLYQKSIFPTINGTNYNVLESLTIEYPETSNRRDYKLIQKNGEFYLNSPINQKVPVVNAINQLIVYISALYADEVVAIGAKLEDYDLDNYDLKITIQVAGTTITGYIKEVEDDSILIGCKETGDVFFIENSNFKIIQQDYTQLLNGRVFQYAMGDLSQIVFKTDNINTTLTPKTDGTALLNGNKIDSKDYDTLVKTLNSFKIESEYSGTIENEVELSFEVLYQNGSKEIVEFIPLEEDSYLVRVNNKINFTTTKECVTNLLNLL